MARVTVYQDKVKEWRWVCVASNGEKVADSGEGYTRKADAVNAAQAVFPNHQPKPFYDGYKPEPKVPGRTERAADPDDDIHADTPAKPRRARRRKAED